MNNPKISIIVPAYNIAPYLSACLDSLLAQTYSNIEVIVVNDGSSDDTAVVMDEYAAKDSRIKAIHKENGGVTSARFCGIEQATGEWIGFVDGDDVVDADMYERLLSNALQYGAQISHCGYRLICSDGDVRYFYNTGKVVRQDNLTGLKDLLEGAFVEPGLCNKLFHKSVFQSLLNGGEMDFSIRNNEDLLMNAILFKESKMSVFEDFCPYQYISRQGSATRNGLAEYKVFDPIRVKEKLLMILPTEIKREAEKAYVMTCMNIYNDLLGLQDKSSKQFCVSIRQKIIQNYEYIAFVSSKYRFIAGCIRYAPWLYHTVYALYSLVLRKKKYE